MAGLARVKEALASAGRVGIDTEWYGETASGARLATIQLAPEGIQLAPEGIQLAPEGIQLAPEGIQLAPEGIQRGGATGGNGAEAFVIEAITEISPAGYAECLGAMLRELLLDRSPPLAVGFAFAADATKLADWLVATKPAAQSDSGSFVSTDDERAVLEKALRSGTLDVQRLAIRAGLGERGRHPSLQVSSNIVSCKEPK